MGLPMPQRRQDAPWRQTRWEDLSSRLRRVATGLLGPNRPDDVEDLVQEALARVMSRDPSRMNEFPYLRRTLIRLWLDEQRSFRRRLQRRTRWALVRPAFHQDADRLSQREQLQAARRALDRLTPLQRAVFVLRIVDESPYQDIAETLDTSVETVRSSMHAARSRLRQAIEKKEAS